MADLPQAVSERAAGRCELCGATGGLTPFSVSGAPSAAAAVIGVCGGCAPELAPGAELDPKRWFGLGESIWSDIPAVQVASWRLLTRLSAEGWAADLLEQAYLADDVRAWAMADAGDEDTANVAVVDANGTPLHDGDTVTLIKDLDVKGTTFVAKRGTTVKHIRLGDDPELVEGRVNKVRIYLKTCFLKRLGA